LKKDPKDPTRFYEVGGFLAWLGKWVKSYPYFGRFPSEAGPNNQKGFTTDVDTTFCNDGRPNMLAMLAFQRLTNEIQGWILSSLTFYSDPQFYAERISSMTGQSLTRPPIPEAFYEGRINTQVYPTYWTYVDGKKKGEQLQADSPWVLFPNTDMAHE
jgi:hypothetical protein